VARSLAGRENVSVKGCDAAVGAPERPRPPDGAGLPLDALTDEGLVAHMEIAGLVMFVAGAAEAPREGNASSEAVSTVLEAP
jgi:hypothetical protein